MRPNESLEKIGIAALSILHDIREGDKEAKLNIYQLSKRSGLSRKLIYSNLHNIRRINNVY